jgi:hypothetical protein
MGMDLANNYGPFYFNGTEKKKRGKSLGTGNHNRIGAWILGRLSDAGKLNGAKGEKDGLRMENEPMRYINDNGSPSDEMHAQWLLKKL